MKEFTRRYLWLISFNLLVAAWCAFACIYPLVWGSGNISLSILNFFLSGANVIIAATNYQSMQRQRKLAGLEPFMIRRIKVPEPIFAFIQKHLYK